ncbi:MAG: hypothetical protein FJX80_09305 [Bacteroidetes bacterium]|nr:hypothetical protein [Bacteroidota bacterium]
MESNAQVAPTSSKNQQILNLISEYKKYISQTQLKDEVYKWELLNKFKGRPDVNAENFETEYKSVKFANLMYYLSFSVGKHICREKPEEFRQLFVRLFDEKTDLSTRVRNFNKESLVLYQSIGEEKGHHQDDRAISVYLTFHNPEKYTFYKSTFYSDFCDLLEIPTAGKNERYTHYLELLSNFIEEYIIPDTDLIESIKSLIPQYYDGTNHLLLAQDILYCMLNKVTESKDENFIPEILEAIESESFQNFIHEDEFYFEKAKNAFDEFKSLQLSDPSILEKIEQEFKVAGKFKDYYIGLNQDSEEYTITNSIAKLISYCDSNAAFKNELNETTDKRVLAKAGVRQNNWFENLIEFKKKQNYNILSSSIKNALIYLENPNQGITMLSDNHREKFIKAFVPSKQFKADNFIDDILDFFKPYEIRCKNELNYTRALSAILYNYQPVRNLWLDIVEENDELKNNNLNNNDMILMPLNQILYGPPGTGKTYTTIDKVAEICQPDQYLENNHEANKRVYDQLLKEGRVVFTTFHQSMSYEDFIEGIKPLKPGDEDQFLKYDVEPGILYQLANIAKKVEKRSSAQVDWDNCKFFKMSIGGKNRPDIHDWCIQNNVVGLGWGGDEDLAELKNIYDWYVFRDRFRELFPVTVQENRYHIQAAFIFNKMKIGDIVVITKGNHIIDAIGKVVGDYYFNDQNPTDFCHFRKVEWIATDMNASPEKFIEKQISQQSIYEFYDGDVKKNVFKELTAIEVTEEKPYVLVIDEINRGNVSAIFGELITLIEEDKRIGKANELRSILPYSKERFGLPSNLYIIGTMNTADRSVEALDTALRRRFSFVEMLPKPELLKDKGENNSGEIEGIDLFSLLSTINERIEVLVDRDHTIGHAFFINDITIQDLRNTFANKIIPLLQEYFYGNYSKMELVIGSAFFEKKEVSKVKFAIKSDDFEAEGQVYHIKNISEPSVMSDEDFISALTILINGEA